MESWEKVGGLNRKEIEKLQNKKLSYFLRTQIPRHPFYRNFLLESKIKFSDIKTIDDLKKIHFTTKEDIAPIEGDVNRPLRFVLEGKGNKYKLMHVHFTAGRTASPTPFFYTAYDLRNLREVGKRLFGLFRASENEIAVNAFPYMPHLAFWQTYFALNASGIMALHTGGGKILGSEKIIKSISWMKATTLLGMPGYVYHLLRTASEENVDLSSLKKVILGGERISDGLRKRLKDFVDVEVLSTYGFTEGKAVWGQCHEDSGYHLYPDLEYVELVDKNGERVGEGEQGEVVYSALDWSGSVVLRYKTGDICDGIYYDKCEYCGKTIRLGNKIERKSEIKEVNFVKLKGSLVNLNLFYSLINEFSEVIEWQIEIKKKNDDPYELDELYLYISIKEGVDFEKLKMKINEKVKDVTEVSFSDIVKVDLDELLERLGIESELKERRIVDRR